MLNFSYDEQQLLIADSLSKYVEKKYSFEQRQKIIHQKQSFCEEVWGDFSELGWLAIPFSEEVGGLGSRPSDINVLMQELGRAMLLEPYYESIIKAGKLLEFCQHSATAQQYLESTISGEKKGVLAVQEMQVQVDYLAYTSELVKHGDQLLLNAKKQAVTQAQHADFFIVSVLYNEQQALCIVPAAEKGITLDNYQQMDGTTAATVNFEGVVIQPDQLIASADQVPPIMQKLEHWSSLALAAEAVGIMQALIEKTVAYTKTRKQFGFPISFFQALQHRMVDMDLAYEQTLSLVYRCINAMQTQYQNESDDNENNLELEISALRYYLSKSVKKVAEEAIQMHGGMGLTDELDIGHYAKRLFMISFVFGNEVVHLKRLCETIY